MHLLTRTLLATSAVFLAAITLTHAVPSVTSTATTTSTTCPTTTKPIIIAAQLSTSDFSLEKCYTCIYVPPIPNTAGVGIVANVTGLCPTCKDGQISLATEGLYNIYGRKPGRFQVPLSPIVNDWQPWDCSKSAPPTRTPSPGSATS
ncbi:hypothetical protein BDF22DRAFT_651844 [Syncephalis plumigaleata]|nr:hypothetical protein BDF22DRAFT_651844 [Syncephalis plumigaleata]